MYHFKAALRHADKRKRGSWHHVWIEEEKTLWDLDQALREALGHEPDDHHETARREDKGKARRV